MISFSGRSIDPAAIDGIVRAGLEASQVPGAAVAVVCGDEVVYLKGFGVKERGRDEPVTPQTLFAIASTTKAFTTTAMALLVDEGKMAWDDPVRKHVPFFRLSDPLADANVTLRDLVCHRTGLSRHDMLWFRSPWGREEIIEKIGRVELSASFRSTYQYQNILFLVAGCAVGRAAGTTWEGFVRERLFDPLGMSGANFSATDAEKAPDHAQPHRKNKQGKVEVTCWRNHDNCGPAGSINAPVRDLSRWVRFQLAGGTFEGRTLVSAESLAETHTPQMVMRLDEDARALYPETAQRSYGLGWSIQDYRGQTLVSHAGSLGGFRAQVALVPQAKLGIVVLANLAGTWLPEAARNGLLDLFLGLETRDWNALAAEREKKSEAQKKDREKQRDGKRHKKTKPSRELAAYTGAYEEPAYGTTHVSLENGSLALQWSSFTGGLKHFHFDTFTFTATEDHPLDDEQLVFSLDPGGEVATMKFLGREFQKVKPEKATGGPAGGA